MESERNYINFDKEVNEIIASAKHMCILMPAKASVSFLKRFTEKCKNLLPISPDNILTSVFNVQCTSYYLT